jgi:NAD(P)H dehydrogenase (quinone)
VPKGSLRAGTAIVFKTSNSDPERELNVFGYPLEMIWKNCVFGLCGVHAFHRRTCGVVITSIEAQRGQWLDEVKATIDSMFPNEENLQ